MTSVAASLHQVGISSFRLPPRLPASTIIPIDVGPSIPEDFRTRPREPSGPFDALALRYDPPFATYRCTGPVTLRFHSVPLPVRPSDLPQAPPLRETRASRLGCSWFRSGFHRLAAYRLPGLQ
ncbi:MAG: hypothetical protein Kow0026_15240 [Oricola sp.]